MIKKQIEIGQYIRFIGYCRRIEGVADGLKCETMLAVGDGDSTVYWALNPSIIHQPKSNKNYSSHILKVQKK